MLCLESSGGNHTEALSTSLRSNCCLWLSSAPHLTWRQGLRCLFIFIYLQIENQSKPASDHITAEQKQSSLDCCCVPCCHGSQRNHQVPFFFFWRQCCYFNCMCLCARERYMHAQEGRDAQRSGGLDLPGAIGRGSCELPDLHAKNQLRSSARAMGPLNHWVTSSA